MSATGLSQQKLQELQAFVESLQSNPQLIHAKELSFFKNFLTTFQIPQKPKESAKPSQPSPSHATEASSEHVEPMEEEPPIEDDGLMQPEKDAALEVPDVSIEVTEEMIDEANQIKMDAMDAYREGRLQESLDMFTNAIRKNPHSGIMFASRAQVLLDMKRPLAALKDTEVAVQVAPNSAKAYKIRAKVQRALGQYEQALKDVQTGQKIDWDEESNKLEATLKPFVEKTLARKKKQQQRSAHSHSHSHDHGHSHSHGHDHHDHDHGSNVNDDDDDIPNPFTGKNPYSGGFQMPPGGMGGKGGMPDINPGSFPPELINMLMQDPEIAAAASDPATLSKFQECMKDPSKIAQYQNDPKFARLMSKFGSMFGGKF